MSRGGVVLKSLPAGVLVLGSILIATDAAFAVGGGEFHLVFAYTQGGRIVGALLVLPIYLAAAVLTSWALVMVTNLGSRPLVIAAVTSFLILWGRLMLFDRSWLTFQVAGFGMAVFGSVAIAAAIVGGVRHRASLKAGSTSEVILRGLAWAILVLPYGWFLWVGLKFGIGARLL